MRNIRVPRLSFSPWTRWEDRRSISDAQYPGVYLMRVGYRRFLGERASVEDSHYIGMSNSQKGLLSRWSQFDRSIRGMRGHSGGNLIYSELGHYVDWQRKLFVAAMPVICNTRNPTPHDYKQMGIVAYLEYEAFSVYRKKHPRVSKPKFNTK